MKIGVVTATYEEVERLVEPIEHKTVIEQCGRVFYEFECSGVDVVAVFSHWGKVASALTVSLLVQKFHPDMLVSVGAGCAVVPDLNLGDIVVGQRLFQHDMDVRPIFRRYEVPLSGTTSYVTQENEQKIAADAIHNLLKQSKDLRKELLAYNILAPKMQFGDMACGDFLITGAARKAAINRNLPSVLCVDMESAAMAQACADFALPFVFVRIISETANEVENDENTNNFKNDYLSKYNNILIEAIVSSVSNINL